MHQKKKKKKKPDTLPIEAIPNASSDALLLQRLIPRLRRKTLRFPLKGEHVQRLLPSPNLTKSQVSTDGGETGC